MMAIEEEKDFPEGGEKTSKERRKNGDRNDIAHWEHLRQMNEWDGMETQRGQMGMEEEEEGAGRKDGQCHPPMDGVTTSFLLIFCRRPGAINSFLCAPL